MVQLNVRKVGGEYLIPVPSEEAERLGLANGDQIEFEILSIDGTPVLRQELRDALMETWDADVEAYRYLAGR